MSSISYIGNVSAFIGRMQKRPLVEPAVVRGALSGHVVIRMRVPSAEDEIRLRTDTVGSQRRALEQKSRHELI